MSARYPFGTHRGSFPSKIEVITAPATNASGVSALRDVYGALTLTGPGVSIPARVTRTRIEDMDTQPAVTTNRTKLYTDGIKAYLPPVPEALALKVSSILRYQGFTYTVIQVIQPVDLSDTTVHVQVSATSDPGQTELGPRAICREQFPREPALSGGDITKILVRHVSCRVPTTITPTIRELTGQEGQEPRRAVPPHLIQLPGRRPAPATSRVDRA
jgi:hypothetical protein